MAYLPPLDRCFDGQDPLISWSSILHRFTLDAECTDDGDLWPFLADPDAIEVLARSSKPFGARNEQSKRDFETRTAPIHVSSSASGSQKLEQLKGDALWLSKELDISEVAALRLAIVERQSRIADLVLDRVFDEAATNGSSSTRSSLDMSDVVRHRRLLQVYMNEGNAIGQMCSIMMGLSASQTISKPAGQHTWILRSAARLEAAVNKQAEMMQSSRLATLIKDVKEQISLLQDDSTWPASIRNDFSVQGDFACAILTRIASNVQQGLAYLHAVPDIPGADTVLEWFKLMQSIDFAQEMRPATADHEIYIELVQSLLSVFSVALLRLPEAVAEIIQLVERNDKAVSYPRLADKPYVLDDLCVRDVNTIMFEAAGKGSAIAAPAILAWSLIALTIRDAVREEQNAIHRSEDERDGSPIGLRHGSITRRYTAMEKKFDALQIKGLEHFSEDPAHHLAGLAVDRIDAFAIIAQVSRVLSARFSTTTDSPTAHIARLALYEVVRESLQHVAYDGHIVEAMLALLAPEVPSQTDIPPFQALAVQCWHDEECQMRLVQQAMHRYPYELSPLLRLLNCFAVNLDQDTETWTALVESFEQLSSMTLILPDGFRGYTLEHEEEGANTFRLTISLPFTDDSTVPQSNREMGEDSSALQSSELDQATQIPAGTHGTILRDLRPFIVSLNHCHSGLSYVGLLLAALSPNARYSITAPCMPIDRALAADIVNLVVTLVQDAHDRTHAEHILEELSANITGGQDAIATITDLLEAELLAQGSQTSQVGSLELSIQCVRFVQSASKYYPERLWSFLSHSTLLSSNHGSTVFSANPGSSQAAAKQARFAYECSRLYSIAIEDAVKGLVRRKKGAAPARSGSRFDSPMESLGDISERVISQTLVSYTAFAIELLQAFHQRADTLPDYRAEAITCLTTSFTRLLHIVYGVGDSVAESSCCASLLAPAAQSIVKTFIPDDSQITTIFPFLTPLFSVSIADNIILPAGQRAILVKLGFSLLSMLTLLLRIARALERPSTGLATALLSKMGLFSPMFAVQAPFQGQVATLLTEVVHVLESPDSDPVSLFSQMPSKQGSMLLGLLTRFERPLLDDVAESKIWALFAAACKYGQQWFAMYLITGSLPKKQIKEKREEGKTAMNKALTLLSDIKNLNPDRASAVLSFVSEAQRAWTWATSIVRSHPDFLTNALRWLDELKPPARMQNSADAMLFARECHLAAMLCDVLAVSLHASLELGDRSLSKLVLTNSSFLTSHAARVDGFNRNLQTFLSDNISKRFTNFMLTDISRTSINPAGPGNDYMYDIEIARELLEHDPSWQGTGRAQAQGFVDEITRANINWSLYHTQIDLLNNWKTLAITLANSIDSDNNLASALTTTVISCLSASADTNLDEPKAEAILQDRADLLFALLSKLVKLPCTKENADLILQKAWSLVRANPVDYDIAQAGADLHYYRKLLQILFLSIRLSNTSGASAAHASSSHPVPTTDGALMKVDFDKDSILAEIMTRVITNGFRALCGNLHQSPDCALPEDFALLVALARSVLAGSCSAHFYGLVADAVAFSGVVRSAASMFSWSDRLAEVTDGDPIYAELAVMFLSTLSRAPKVAETLAVEDVLTQLSSANLSNNFRRPGGMGPFDEPGRMFVIWSNGFLPLCLNLIEAVGPPIAPQVSSFLGSFPEQLSRAEKALQNASPSARNPRAGAVTLGLLSEARDLIMLSQILESALDRGAAEGISVEDIQPLKYDARAVGEDIESLTKSQRSLRDRIVPVTPREVALYNDKNGGGRDDALQAAIVQELDIARAMSRV